MKLQRPSGGTAGKRPAVAPDCSSNHVYAQSHGLSWYSCFYASTTRACLDRIRFQELEEELSTLRHELVAAQEVAARASATWDK